MVKRFFCRSFRFLCVFFGIYAICILSVLDFFAFIYYYNRGVRFKLYNSKITEEKRDVRGFAELALFLTDIDCFGNENPFSLIFTQVKHERV